VKEHFGEEPLVNLKDFIQHQGVVHIILEIVERGSRQTWKGLFLKTSTAKGILKLISKQIFKKLNLRICKIYSNNV
jgi:hypothetical protein